MVRSRVLLIEPDNVLAESVRLYLVHNGYDVSVAHDAQTAVHSADMAMPDIIILELQLAGHSGIEFLYEFRSYPDWKSLPVVLYSIVPPTRLSLHPALCAQLGITAHLYKPTTSLQKLERSIQRTIGVRS